MYGANEVSRGLACDVYCPSCKGALVAKQGVERAWHFAHYSGSDPTRINARTCGETSLHEYAKQVLVDSVGKVLKLPNLPTFAQSDFQPLIKITWARAEEQKRINETIRRVDVLLQGQIRRQSNSRPGRGWEKKTELGVEVCVTSPKKLDYQEDLMEWDKLSVIELYIPFNEVESKVNGYYRDIGWAEAVRLLIRGHSTSNRRWLYVRGTRRLPN